MKTYMIVTNDEYELPVSGEIIGAPAVAEKLNMPILTLRCYLRRGFPKKSKTKVVVVKEKQITDEKAYYRERGKRYSMTHDRTGYQKQYYQRKKAEGELITPLC